MGKLKAESRKLKSENQEPIISTLTTVLGLLAAGATEAQVLGDYPDLEPEDIKACLSYATWLTREREIELQPT